MSHHRIKRVPSVSNSLGTWHVLWPVWAICSFLLLLGVFVVVREYRAELPKKSDIPVIAVKEGEDLHLDSKKLDSRDLHLFEVSSSGKKVKIVVQQTDDQSVHVAIASCRACYRNRDHHYAKQGQMMCGKCDGPMKFESKDQKTDTNSCALVEISSQSEKWRYCSHGARCPRAGSKAASMNRALPGALR